MSTTPRTDQFLTRPDCAWDAQWIGFARELERDITALRAELVVVRGNWDAANRDLAALRAELHDTRSKYHDGLSRRFGLQSELTALRDQLAEETEDHKKSIRGHIETVRSLEDRICKQAELRIEAERERDEAIRREADCRQILHTFTEDDDPVVVSKLRVECHRLRAELTTVKAILNDETNRAETAERERDKL